MQFFDLPTANISPDALGFSPDGRLLAVWAFGRVFLIDTTAGTTRTLQSESDGIMWGSPGVGFTPDGRGVIALTNFREGRQRAAVRVYDVDSGELRQTFQREGLEAMEPAADGRLVYLAMRPTEQSTEIVLWDPVTGKKQRGFGQHTGFLRQLAVSADGQWVAGSPLNEIRVWDIRGGKRPTRAARKVQAKGWRGIGALALSADGGFVAAEGSGVAVWEVGTGAMHPLSDWGGHRGRSVAFHPTAPVLAYTTRSDEVVFWDPRSRSELHRFSWDIGWLLALAFSLDGMRCAAGSKGKVVVWDVTI
jgi:WD40 repeat protein